MNRASSRDAWSFCRLLVLTALLMGHAGCATTETNISPGSGIHPASEVEPLPPRLNAEQETKRVTDLIENTKPATPDIAPKLQKASDSVITRSFGALVDAKLIVGTPQLTCFTEGCLYRVVYVNRCAQLRADAIFSSDRGLALLEWPGSVGRTPPVTDANGQVSVTWTLYLTPKQYPLLDQIPRPGGTTFPPPVPPCSAAKSAPEAK